MSFYKKKNGQMVNEVDLIRRAEAKDSEAVMEVLDIFEEQVKNCDAQMFLDKAGNMVVIQNGGCSSMLQNMLFQGLHRLSIDIMREENGKCRKKTKRAGKSR